MRSEFYPHNPFAEQLFNQIRGISFGDQYELTALVNQELVEAVKASPLGGIDYRAKIGVETGYATVFDGLAFDPERVRSQSFTLLNRATHEPVAIMSAVIAPQGWINEQRYFQMVDGGVKVCNFSSIGAGSVPDYVIIPAWTMVIPEHLGEFALPGYRAFTRVMDTIQAFAPQNTWIEAIAKGLFPTSRTNELKSLADRGVGTFIPQSDLPFSIDIVGQNHYGSASSVKMAARMGLQRAEGMGSAITLGPVFVKQVK